MIEQHLVCAWTMLLLLYIVTLSIDSPVSELVWTDQCNGMVLIFCVAELETRKPNPSKIDAWNQMIIQRTLSHFNPFPMAAAACCSACFDLGEWTQMKAASVVDVTHQMDSHGGLLSRKSSPNQKCWWRLVSNRIPPSFAWNFRTFPETSQMSPSRLEIKGDELSIAFIKGQARWCDLTGRTPACDILKSQLEKI